MNYLLSFLTSICDPSFISQLIMHIMKIIKPLNTISSMRYESKHPEFKEEIKSKSQKSGYL